MTDIVEMSELNPECSTRESPCRHVIATTTVDGQPESARLAL